MVLPPVSDQPSHLSGPEYWLSSTDQILVTRDRTLLDHPALRDVAVIGRSMEQNVRVALSIATMGYVMENGRVVLDGTADFLANNEDVKEFYMGLSAMGTKKSYREVKHYKRRKRWL